MIIKFCLLITAKLPSTYEDLRFDIKKGSGILVLPSRRTLMDYRNYICPKRGFNPEIEQELRRKTITKWKRRKILFGNENNGMILCRLVGFLINWLLENFLVKRLYFNSSKWTHHTCHIIKKMFHVVSFLRTSKIS